MFATLTPSAVMRVSSAVITIWSGEPVRITSTESVPTPEEDADTVEVPVDADDWSITVAVPDEAFFVVVPSSAPCPETLNVIELSAESTLMLFPSIMVAVISEVVLPSASMDMGEAVQLMPATVWLVVVKMNRYTPQCRADRFG